PWPTSAGSALRTRRLTFAACPELAFHVPDEGFPGFAVLGHHAAHALGVFGAPPLGEDVGLSLVVLRGDALHLAERPAPRPFDAGAVLRDRPPAARFQAADGLDVDLCPLGEFLLGHVQFAAPRGNGLRGALPAYGHAHGISVREL